MSSVLVTGGAGYIGSHTAKALARAGYRLVVFDNLSTGHRWAVKWGDFVEGDLNDYETLYKTLKRYRITAVLHFAAVASVSESILDPEKYFSNNVGAALTLFRSMLAAGVSQIVFSSSCAVYGNTSILPITEAARQTPVSPYGESKLIVEKMLQWYAGAYSLRSVSLRYFNAAGADKDGEVGECHDPETHLIPSVIETALGKRPVLEVFGTDYDTSDGTAIRDYIHVSDLAEAHVLALEYLESQYGSNVFNLGTGRGFSVREVIRSVERVSGRHVEARFKPRRAGDPPALIASAALAQAELKWRPRVTDLDEIVETAWRWHVGREPGTAPSDNRDVIRRIHTAAVRQNG